MKKRGRKKKKKNSFDDDDDEEYDGDSEYHDSESEFEENEKAKKGLEAEELEDELEEKEMREDSDFTINDLDDETYTMNSKHKKHKKLIKKITSDSENESNKNKDKNKNQEYKRDNNFLKNKYHKLLMDKITNDKLPHQCYFCRQTFQGDRHSLIKLFGPFYFNEITGKVSETKKSTNPNNTSEKEIYIDFNCLAKNNDFSQTTRKDTYNPTSSIDEVIKNSKICFRCGSIYATKECCNDECHKWFHGNFCLEQMTVEYNDNRYCLECFKKKRSKYLLEKSKQININFEKLDRSFFLCDKIYNSKYYPQKNEEIYFILHAYMQYLRDHYLYIIYETEEKKQRLFWWMENTYIEKNRQFNFFEPFLCKVKNIEFIFPNAQTIALIKETNIISENDKINRNPELKILIKLQLEIIDLKDTEITIIQFDNENPDFLVRKKIYEETLKYYNENILNKKDLINLEVNLDEDITKATLVENKAEENNENFLNSKFNSLKMKVGKEKTEQSYSFWDLCINGNNNGLINEKMKFIMSGLKDTINSVYKKNEMEVKVFWDKVPENNDYQYYNVIPVPMYLKLILSRLENEYYLNESSLKFDIDLLVNNSINFNTEKAQISQDAIILRQRFFNRIEELSKKFKENTQVISNGTNIKITLNSDSGGSGLESLKKMVGKKRKRLLADIDIDENMFKTNDYDYDDSDDYLFGHTKKRETRSSIHNLNEKNENISIDIELNEENGNGNGTRRLRRKKI